jgi:L-ascorbate metabolism protein UlaG (beta-lactamase superfamily)
MKRIIFCWAFWGFVSGLSALSPEAGLAGIRWYGQSSLRLELGGKIIWLDPVNVGTSEVADIILIIHGHPDHFSPADIKRLSGPKTLVLTGFEDSRCTRISPGDTKILGNVTIEAVPAYNVVKAEKHPKSAAFCGFVIAVDGLRIYDAGDTERIPEMKSIACDIAFLPLGQTYTMNSVEEAERAVMDVKAKIAIPFHFGLYEGTQADARKFVSDLQKKGVKAVILAKEH